MTNEETRAFAAELRAGIEESKREMAALDAASERRMRESRVRLYSADLDAPPSTWLSLAIFLGAMVVVGLFLFGVGTLLSIVFPP